MDCKTNKTEVQCKISGCSWVNAKKPFCRKPASKKKPPSIAPVPPPPPPPAPLLVAPVPKSVCNENDKKYVNNPGLYVCNPDTKNWVLKTGVKGKQLLAAAAKKKKTPPLPVPVVVMPPPPVEAPKPVCNDKNKKYLQNPDLYICNPDTKHWVLKTSAKGKQLLAAAAKKKTPAVPAAVPAAVPPPAKPVCNEKNKKYLKNPDLYICNPTTKVWVLKTSALGKKLLKGFIPKKKIYYVPPYMLPKPLPPPPPPVFSPVKMTSQLKAYMTKKVLEFKDTLKKPRLSFFTNKIQFHVEKYHKTTGWKDVTLEISEFPYKFVKTHDFPYLPDGSVDPTRMNRLVFNDLNGMTNNASWFPEQVAYIKTLSKVDRDLIYSYTVSPGHINTSEKVARLQEIILNSPPLHATMVVWRGVKNNYVTVNDKNVYTNEKRFISTSIESRIAIDTFMGPQCCLFKIVLLKGSRCLFLAASNYQVEHEILLHKDSLFYVLRHRVRPLNIPHKPSAQMVSMLYLT